MQRLWGPDQDPWDGQGTQLQASETLPRAGTAPTCERNCVLREGWLQGTGLQQPEGSSSGAALCRRRRDAILSGNKPLLILTICGCLISCLNNSLEISGGCLIIYAPSHWVEAQSMKKAGRVGPKVGHRTPAIAMALEGIIVTGGLTLAKSQSISPSPGFIH